MYNAILHCCGEHSVGLDERDCSQRGPETVPPYVCKDLGRPGTFTVPVANGISLPFCLSTCLHHLTMLVELKPFAFPGVESTSDTAFYLESDVASGSFGNEKKFEK